MTKAWMVASSVRIFQGLASQRLQFSCTCLSLTDNVFSFESQWNGLFLDGTGFYKSSFSISASNSADKLNSLNFTLFFFLKVVQKPPYRALVYTFSFHDVSSTKRDTVLLLFHERKVRVSFATHLIDNTREKQKIVGIL